MQGIQITGMGAALPANRVTNEDLARIVDTSDEWIRTRTGIRSRYFSKGETHTQLCTEAARNALEDAGVTPDQIGLCVVATISADYNTPSAASLVQAALGIPEDTPSFDVNAACAGFVYGLNVVSAMLGCGNIERPYALLIGAEQLSRMLNMQDRGTCVLFGDGAAAAPPFRQSPVFLPAGFPGKCGSAAYTGTDVSGAVDSYGRARGVPVCHGSHQSGNYPDGTGLRRICRGNRLYCLPPGQPAHY